MDRSESEAQNCKHGTYKKDPDEVPANEEHLLVASSLSEEHLEVVMAFVQDKKSDFVLHAVEPVGDVNIIDKVNRS